MRIAIDLMGSDKDPEILFQGVLHAVKRLDSVCSFFVIATPSILKKITPLDKSVKNKIVLTPASQCINMDDSPLLAVRRKKDSTLVVGLRLLHEKKVDGLVTAGNTGALIVGARIMMKPIADFVRPGLLAIIPTQKEPMVVVDIGGNVSCTTLQLIQFAQMGLSYQSCFFGNEKPKVGILNIGIESKKGTAEHRIAYEVLKKISKKTGSFFFKGNVEGKQAFLGEVDILITDGFTGNVFLKTAEGVSFFLLHSLKKAYQAAKIKFPEEVKPHLQQQFSYEEYSGAVLCGVDGIIVKCHGDSSAKEMTHGILHAANLIEKNLLEHLQAKKGWTSDLNFELLGD